MEIIARLSSLIRIQVAVSPMLLNVVLGLVADLRILASGRMKGIGGPTVGQSRTLTYTLVLMKIWFRVYAHLPTARAKQFSTVRQHR